jgi:hypothetical protein
MSAEIKSLKRKRQQKSEEMIQRCFATTKEIEDNKYGF